MNKFITMLRINAHKETSHYYGDEYLRDNHWQYVVLFMEKLTDNYIRKADLIHDKYMKEIHSEETSNEYDYQMRVLNQKHRITNRTDLRRWLNENEITESDVIEFFLALSSRTYIPEITPMRRKNLMDDVAKYKEGLTISCELMGSSNLIRNENRLNNIKH